MEERAHILSALGGAHTARPANITSTTGSAVAGCLGDPNDVSSLSQLDQVVSFCLDPNGPVRDQDRIHGLSVCASWSSSARQATWRAIKADWIRLSEVYHGQFLLAHLIKVSYLQDIKRYGVEKELYSSHPL